MENLEKKFTVWLLTRKFARNLEEAQAFAKAVMEGKCSEEIASQMAESNRSNMDVMMEIGKVTPEKIVPFMQGKLELAQKCIVFWEEHVKDTNAIFFRRKYEENYGSYD
ncbi:MAG: hypothetical protein IJU00_00915 [Selenomonas sp.]|nr:hypothetical protein [Selenomonas sp.]